MIYVTFLLGELGEITGLPGPRGNFFPSGCQAELTITRCYRSTLPPIRPGQFAVGGFVFRPEKDREVLCSIRRRGQAATNPGRTARRSQGASRWI